MRTVGKKWILQNLPAAAVVLLTVGVGSGRSGQSFVE